MPMEGYEIDEILHSFQIIVDTREQPSQRATKRLDSMGVPYNRQKLEYGDYTYNFVFPNGQPLYNDNSIICPDVCIERKMDLDELAGCFCKDRDRFQRELDRAAEHYAVIYLLVENANWENLLNGRYRSQMHPNAYLGSITGWEARYGFRIIFCKEETSGKLIKEILYRELKHKLECGFYG